MTQHAPRVRNDGVSRSGKDDSERHELNLRPHRKVKWAAELTGVREVSLFGRAELQFWSNRLAAEDLIAAQYDGHAQIMIIAAAAKYMGLRFAELSVSVLVQGPGPNTQQDAAYLVGAFNSRAFFAFCERVIFSTPYEHGGVSVSAALPANIELVEDGRELFKAEMGPGLASGERQPLRSEEDGWEGPVFLPSRGRKTAHAGKLFFARLRGFTRVYPFLVSTDSLSISPTSDSEVLRTLCDSHFVAIEWVIRENALHAKSKTYNRGDLFS